MGWGGRGTYAALFYEEGLEDAVDAALEDMRLLLGKPLAKRAIETDGRREKRRRLAVEGGTLVGRGREQPHEQRVRARLVLSQQCRGQLGCVVIALSERRLELSVEAARDEEDEFEGLRTWAWTRGWTWVARESAEAWTWTWTWTC